MLAPPAESTGRLRETALIAGCAIGLSVGFSALYFGTQSIFLKPVAAEFGWSRTQIGTLPSVAICGLAAGAPLLGLLADRLGARRLIGLSALLFSAMIATLSILPGVYPAFILVSFAIGFLGVGTGPSGYLLLLPRLFDRRLGLALSLSMVGAGLGSAILPLVSQAALAALGWRHAYLLLAGIALAGAACAAPMLRVADGGRQPTADQPVKIGASWREALRDRRFWTLFVAIVATTAGGLGATIHSAAIVSDSGLSPANAARITAACGVGLLIGRFVAGFLMDIVFAPLVAAAGFMLGAVGLAVIGLQPDSAFPVLFLCAALFGISLGAEGDFAAFAVRRYFGTRSFGAIYGTIITGYSLGGFIGPVLFGVGFDQLGGYALVLFAAAGVNLLAAAAVLTLGRYEWARA